MKLLGDQGMRKILPLSLLVVTSVFGSNLTSANAAVMTYTTESSFTLGTPSQNPAVQSFENGITATNTTALSSLNAAPFTVTSQTPGVTFGVYDQKDVAGAHATDGDNHIVTSGSEGISQTYSVNFHFNTAVSSFGLWVTDFGDVGFGADLLLGATFTDGTGQAFTIDTNSTGNNSDNGNGNQRFFGIVSNGLKFTDFQLVVTRDPIGFDEVYYDTESVPEPSTFALGAIGMMGLGFWRRKRAAV
jgi:hypothetical protein